MVDTYSISFKGDKANQVLGTVSNFDDSYKEHTLTTPDNYIIEQVTPAGIIPIDITTPVNGLRVSFKIQTPGTGGATTLKIFGLTWGELAVETKTGSNPSALELQAGVQVDFILNTNVTPNKWILAQVVRQSLSRGYNIKDYGAIGDYDPDTNIGTDNTTPIDDTIVAINAQELEGALMDIPTGYYLTQGGHDMVIATTMIGEGASASFYSKDNLSNLYVFKTKDDAANDGDLIVFEDFYINGRRNSPTINLQVGILVSGAYYTKISDITLEEMSNYCIRLQSINRGGGDISYTELTYIENVKVTNSNDGIYVDSGVSEETKDTSISNVFISVISNSAGDGIALLNKGYRTRTYNVQSSLCDNGVHEDGSYEAVHFGLISFEQDTFGVRIEESINSKVVGGLFFNNGQKFSPDAAVLDGVADTITLATHSVTLGDRFRITSTGTLPTGLAENIYYYAVSSVASGIPFQFYDISDSLTPVAFGTDGTGTFSFIEVEGDASGVEIDTASDKAIISNCTFYDDQSTKTQQFGVFLGELVSNSIILANTCTGALEYSYFIDKTATGNILLFNHSEGATLGDYYFDADGSNNAADNNVVISHHLNIVEIINGYIQFYEIVNNVPVVTGAKINKISIDDTESATDEEVWTIKAIQTYVANNTLTTALTDNMFLLGNGLDIATEVLMSGEAIMSNAGVVTLAETAVTGKLLTGYVISSGPVLATDTILESIQKLAGNVPPAALWQRVSTTLEPGTANDNVDIGSGTFKGGGAFYQSDTAAEQVIELATNGSNVPAVILAKLRGTLASPLAVIDNDQIGGVFFHAYSGTAVLSCVAFTAEINGTVGTSQMPADAVISTRTDAGSAPEEAVRIDKNKNIIGQGTFKAKNGIYGRIKIVTSATYTILVSDDTLAVDYTSSGEAILTLPAASACWDSDLSMGKIFKIKDSAANAGTNKITINRAGADTLTDNILGDTSTIINIDGGALMIQAKSPTEWLVFNM